MAETFAITYCKAGEPVETAISKVLNELAENIVSVEGAVLADQEDVICNEAIQEADFSIDGVFHSFKKDATDAYLSTAAYDRFFSYNKTGKLLTGDVCVHKAAWLDSCLAGLLPPGLQCYMGQNVDVILANRNEDFIRFIPYPFRFVTIEYLNREDIGFWEIRASLLHTARKFNAKVFVGSFNETYNCGG